jgi:23S rRNA (cytosine1962-C5)-methyltransferase
VTARLQLKPGEEHRLRAGHLWIFANELARFDQVEPGELVHVYDAAGHALGTAYANPASKIVARMLSKKCLSALKPAWWQDRLGAALAMRNWLFASPHYRWVHGEGDRLPGLVIDRYGDDIVIQAHTAGMERQLPAIAEAVTALARPANIYLNNKTGFRQLEGLTGYTRTLLGTGDGVVTAMEGGLPMHCQALEGQKTGYFYDQRPNREWIGRHCRGRRVLDLFAYVGAFAQASLAGGAVEVVSVDASASALDWARRNIEAAGFADRWRAVGADVSKALVDMAAGGERFDIVISDPPAYVKSRAKLKQGLRGYARLAEEAAHLIKPGGMLCAASCSGLVSADDFRKATVQGVKAAGRGAQIVHEGGAGADHPWLPAMPETRYLKFTAMMLDR